MGQPEEVWATLTSMEVKKRRLQWNFLAASEITANDSTLGSIQSLPSVKRYLPVPASITIAISRPELVVMRKMQLYGTTGNFLKRQPMFPKMTSLKIIDFSAVGNSKTFTPHIHRL
ncbi:hypothetical protein CHS0354_034552 [Potamilus streckersoni]|uniref:Uncharacterized protein n=1 Tax=Potamilus streckersoni TaxID=2493646 RepID=A0AAE0W1A4_9BIVA|nr:hypothetical protein CHS0354_034552 [Potamilus streckersoni]